MTRKLFGTDGVRGTANREPITAETALKLAMAAGSYFTPVSGKQRPLAVIGKDTRLSGYMLESAMVAGFTAVFRLGHGYQFFPGSSAGGF